MEGIDIDNNTIASHHLSNLRVSWNLEKMGSGSQVYMSINNIFDGTPGNLKGLPSIYDMVDRPVIFYRKYSKIPALGDTRAAANARYTHE